MNTSNQTRELAIIITNTISHLDRRVEVNEFLSKHEKDQKDRDKAIAELREVRDYAVCLIQKHLEPSILDLIRKELHHAGRDNLVPEEEHSEVSEHSDFI